MNKFQTMRKNKRKGFTLVEIIVVLVIVAILMAALAPVMIGWINEARDSTIRAEARLFLTAAQGVVTEEVALGRGVPTLAGLKAMPKFLALIGGTASLNQFNPDLSELTAVEIDGSNNVIAIVYTNPRDASTGNRLGTAGGTAIAAGP
ncbi:MAG: prepilin-type N-terminal cleavage/methylation domain-containing protein [Oscillospiraceae bacterium]|jgi:type IV pilus assembly protein PilA|nr:prepilin-type N-terminal cleavage/methylation domain-containing protein [Oscillospiraceae bacterium]